MGVLAELYARQNASGGQQPQANQPKRLCPPEQHGGPEGAWMSANGHDKSVRLSLREGRRPILQLAVSGMAPAGLFTTGGAPANVAELQVLQYRAVLGDGHCGGRAVRFASRGGGGVEWGGEQADAGTRVQQDRADIAAGLKTISEAGFDRLLQPDCTWSDVKELAREVTEQMGGNTLTGAEGLQLFAAAQGQGPVRVHRELKPPTSEGPSTFSAPMECR